MTRLTYLQNRTVYYTLFVAALLDRAPDEVYRSVAPIFFTGEDETLERLMKSEELRQLRSTAMLELYQNYIVSFCEDPNTFGRRKSEMEAIKLKYHVLSIIEELKRSPTANPLAALCENYDKNMSAAYAIALYCSNPRAKTAYTTALKKALRDADGLDACIALLYLEQGKKEWLEALGRNETVQFYPDVREILEDHYRVVS
jgi:hypothetical protein